MRASDLRSRIARALDLASPSPHLYPRKARADRVDEILAQVGGRIQVDRVSVTGTGLDGVASARYVGSVDGTPVCASLTLLRYDERFPLRRTRADGRWFAFQLPFSEQTLAGEECS